MVRSPAESQLNPEGDGNIPEPKTMCVKCRAISWVNPRPGKSSTWRLDHHETFHELEASCEAGCPLCQTFFLYLVYDGIAWKNTSRLQWELWNSGPARRARTDTLWSLTCTSDALPNGESKWSMEAGDRMHPSQAITMVKRLATEDLERDSNALVEECILPWIDACARSGKHENCPSQAAHESDSYSVPTRLIDVKSEGDSTVRLVETSDLSEDNKKLPYVILSYCWGSGNGPACTTTQNLEQRLDAFEYEILPATIKDAIKITRLMKIRYLWVDAVCIIQSDRSADAEQQDDIAKADWERESIHMAAYYANSLCCIAASGAKDSSEGILTERRGAKYGFKEAWYGPKKVPLPSPYRTRREFQSQILDRGWCYQEWILSPRIMHWTANGLIWECQQGFFWEGQRGFQGEPIESFEDLDLGTRPANDCLLNLGLGTYGVQQVCRILRADEGDALSDGWAELVKQFSQMRLTFASDRLAAIHGIATHLCQRHGVDYFAGIFRPRCPEHLMWRVEDPESSVEAHGNFPTWSWASAVRKNGREIVWEFTHGVAGSFSDQGNYKRRSSFVDGLEAFPSAWDEGGLTCMTKKELRFTAPLIRLSILDPKEADSLKTEWEDPEEDYAEPGRSRFFFGTKTLSWAVLKVVSMLPKVWLKKRYLEFLLAQSRRRPRLPRLFRPGSSKLDGVVCDIWVDNVASSPSLRDLAHLLVLWSIPRELRPEYRGLVVQAVEQDAGSKDAQDGVISYRRIGVFSMAYAEEHLEDLPDIKKWMTKIVLV